MNECGSVQQTYSWETLVPLLNGSPSTTPPLLSPPLSAPPVADTPPEEDDDVFEPEGVVTSNSDPGSKRRTQSLSALHNSKEPQSPLKVLTHWFLVMVQSLQQRKIITTFVIML